MVPGLDLYNVYRSCTPSHARKSWIFFAAVGLCSYRPVAVFWICFFSYDVLCRQLLRHGNHAKSATQQCELSSGDFSFIVLYVLCPSFAKLINFNPPRFLVGHWIAKLINYNQTSLSCFRWNNTIFYWWSISCPRIAKLIQFTSLFFKYVPCFSVAPFAPSGAGARKGFQEGSGRTVEGRQASYYCLGAEGGALFVRRST